MDWRRCHSTSDDIAKNNKHTKPREFTTHTDARSAKKDVTSTKPQKASGVERTFPREQKESTTKPPSQVTPAKCRRSRGMLSCVSRAGGGGGQSLWSDTGVVLSPASEARAKLRIFNFGVRAKSKTKSQRESRPEREFARSLYAISAPTLC